MRITPSLLLSLTLIASANNTAFGYYDREYANRLNHESSQHYAKQYEEESQANQQNLALKAQLEQYYQQQLQTHESDDSFFWGRGEQSAFGSRPGSPNIFRPIAFAPTTEGPITADSGQNIASRPLATLQGGIAEINILPRQKPNIKLSDLFFHLEDQLIRLHDSNRIGSLDIDKFSEALLTIKRNYDVMRKQSGQISSRQENILKTELKHLDDEIACRGRQM